MWSTVLLLTLFTSSGFGIPITGHELIKPRAEDIGRCIPETMQEPIHKNIASLHKVAKVSAKLYKVVNGRFSKNCKLLAEYLGELDSDILLNYKNITPRFSKVDRKAIAKILRDADTGFSNFLYILGNLDLHLAGYVGLLHGMLNQGNKTTIIDLIQTVDLIQRGALELQEMFQLLSYLEEAHKKIRGYESILDGMHHQLSFKIIYMINTICTLTEDLRGSYLSLLAKGDCSDEQISHALGITEKKIQAIAAE